MQQLRKEPSGTPGKLDWHCELLPASCVLQVLGPLQELWLLAALPLLLLLLLRVRLGSEPCPAHCCQQADWRQVCFQEGDGCAIAHSALRAA